MKLGEIQSLRDKPMHTTERLTIREFIPEDLGPLTDLFSSSAAMRFIGPRRTLTADEVKKWLNDQISIQVTCVTRRAVALRNSNELIGVCGFQKIDAQWDFGYYFRSTFWGNGFATEAVACLLENADSILNGDEFVIFVADENATSHSVMERCGWKRGKRVVKNDENGYQYIPAEQGTAVGTACCTTEL